MIRIVALSVVLSGSAFAGVISPWQGDSAESQPGMHVSLTPDGPWLAKASESAGGLEVHDASHTRPRFRTYADGVSLLLYAEPEKLATVALTGAVLAPTVDLLANHTDQTPGIVLRPGVILDADADDHGHRKASWVDTWESGSFEVHGFVQSERVGHVYRERMPPVPKYAPDVTLPGNYQLLDKPAGTAFVFSKNRKRVEAMKLATKSGFTLVRNGQDAVGWIATAQVKRRPPQEALGEGEEGGVEGGVLGGASAAQQGVLPRGTVVYDAIGGTPVGEVTSPFTGKQLPAQKGWLQFALATPFGDAIVWAKNPG